MNYFFSLLEDELIEIEIKLEERIKELDKENEQLKEHIQELDDYIEELGGWND